MQVGVLFALFAASCAGFPGMGSGLSLDVFADLKIRAFLHCAREMPDDLLRRCPIGGDKINVRGEHGLTPLVWLLKNDAITPQGVGAMIRAGANPFIIERQNGYTAAIFIVSKKEITYLKAMIEAGVSPNTVVESEPGEGIGPEFSIPEMSFLFWDDDKIDYLVNSGLDLEKRFSGYSAILHAGLIAFDGGPFKKQLFLLDRGADPHGKDNQGKGICYGIETDVDLRRPKDPDYRLILAKRLEKEFGIVCRKTERFQPDWR